MATKWQQLLAVTKATHFYWIWQLKLSSCFQSNTFSFVCWDYENLFHLNRTWQYWIACFLRASCSVVPYLNRSNSIIKIFYYKRSSFDSFQVIFSQIVSIRVVELKLWLVLAVSKLCKSTQPTNWHALVCLFIISFALRSRRAKIRQGEESLTQRKHSSSEMYYNHCFKNHCRNVCVTLCLIKEMSAADAWTGMLFSVKKFPSL